MKKANLAKVVALGGVISAGAGYLAGILTAPKSGKDTRKDLKKSASKVRTDSEKQLKRLHSELEDLVKQAEKKAKGLKSKAGDGKEDATKKAKEAQSKAKEVLSALHNGDADDPNLQAVVEEVKLAKTNLVKFLKK